MHQMENSLAVVKAEATKIDKYMLADLARLEPTVDGLLYEVLKYSLFNGGKRIRPMLVVVSSRLCGKQDGDLYHLSCAFEYLHAATLLHDDIIDSSATRRGNESVYKKFGTIAAILAGDFLHAIAMSTVGRFSGNKGLEIFCNATTGMVDGEFMQLRNTAKFDLKEHDYLDAIKGKTGLLISAACEVGAVYGGGTLQQTLALREYGMNIGCAFQIIDDLLDYLGDSRKTGKTVGNDLAEGKITLPLILTFQEADQTDTIRLLTVLGDRVERSQKISEVSAIISKYDGFGRARKRAEVAVENALTSLQVFQGDGVRQERSVLEWLARYVLTRDK